MRDKKKLLRVAFLAWDKMNKYESEKKKKIVKRIKWTSARVLTANHVSHRYKRTRNCVNLREISLLMYAGKGFFPPSRNIQPKYFPPPLKCPKCRTNEFPVNQDVYRMLPDEINYRFPSLSLLPVGDGRFLQMGLLSQATRDVRVCREL